MNGSCGPAELMLVGTLLLWGLALVIVSVPVANWAWIEVKRARERARREAAGA